MERLKRSMLKLFPYMQQAERNNDIRSLYKCIKQSLEKIELCIKRNKKLPKPAVGHDTTKYRRMGRPEDMKCIRLEMELRRYMLHALYKYDQEGITMTFDLPNRTPSNNPHLRVGMSKQEFFAIKMNKNRPVVEQVEQVEEEQVEDILSKLTKMREELI